MVLSFRYTAGLVPHPILEEDGSSSPRMAARDQIYLTLGDSFCFSSLEFIFVVLGSDHDILQDTDYGYLASSG